MGFKYSRVHYQNQALAQERARAERAPALEIEVLFYSNPRFGPVCTTYYYSNNARACYSCYPNKYRIDQTKVETLRSYSHLYLVAIV